MRGSGQLAGGRAPRGPERLLGTRELGEWTRRVDTQAAGRGPHPTEPQCAGLRGGQPGFQGELGKPKPEEEAVLACGVLASPAVQGKLTLGQDLAAHGLFF